MGEESQIKMSGRSDWPARMLELVAVAFTAILVGIFITTPLQPYEQVIAAATVFAIYLIVNRYEHRGVSIFLALLSFSISMRYLFWRVTSTLEYSNIVAGVIGIALLVAECYAITVLVFGYIQTIWLLERKPVPLPENVEDWPSVDVYVPTYNESLSIVQTTVLACLSIDWPADRLRVYLLDDGRREEFRNFAKAVGCEYITRSDNNHAKAGNLNAAMKVTKGEFIAIFDCDHIPVRAFLQMTMGWMVKNPRIALVQTPHHFYSPDPFQRNMSAGARVPAEGNMFYGLVQDGNDYWNATFFCGSCAVLRRTALNEVGGIAVETVTEDAHTMLKLHRKGWESAYLKLPLAAGLATERLMLHIGQRVRWARGMIQILLVDNAAKGPGLTLGQRICYLQAGGHFLFAIPRIIFLLAPLAYLLLGQNILAASPLAITAYAFPHMVMSIAVNSRFQKNWRHSFWSEIYETVLALFLVRITIQTLIDPKSGKFNVTTKGGLLDKGYFDLAAVYPNLILGMFLTVGVVRGILTLIFQDLDSLTFQAFMLNSIWGTFSLLIVMAALTVGRERRQTRAVHRVRAKVQGLVALPDGRTVPCVTRDLSEGGADILALRPEGVPEEATFDIQFSLGGEIIRLPAKAIKWRERYLRVRWNAADYTDTRNIVRVVFGRADAWVEWADYPVDRPLSSLKRVAENIVGLFRSMDRQAEPPTATGTSVTEPINGASTEIVAQQTQEQLL